MQEAYLINRLKEGDQSAFKELVDANQNQVFNTCLGFVQNGEDAEDLSQEVFLEVYRSVAKFRGESKLSTWLYRIAVTKSLEYLRKKKRKKRMAFFQAIRTDHSHIEIADNSFSHPGVQLENKERAQVLFAAIARLPESQRTAFTLHKMESLSYKEIGVIMGSSLSSVESLMHRAKKNLQKILYDYYKKEL